MLRECSVNVHGQVVDRIHESVYMRRIASYGCRTLCRAKKALHLSPTLLSLYARGDWEEGGAMTELGHGLGCVNVLCTETIGM